MNRRTVLLRSGVTLPTILAGCSADEGDDATDPEGGDTDDTGGNGDGNGNGDAPEDDEPKPDDEDDGSDEDDEDADEDEGEDVDEPAPQTFSGTGSTVEDSVRIVGNLTVVDAEHQGESNFRVSLVNDGAFDDNVVNEIGDYNGETVDLIDGGEYMLDVEADGSWEIEIRQPRAASGDSLPQSLSDDRNRVFGPIEFNGTHLAEGSHGGESNFQVLPAEGSFGENVFNEIGEYDGENTFNFDGVGWVAVVADDEWTLDLA